MKDHGPAHPDGPGEQLVEDVAGTAAAAGFHLNHEALKTAPFQRPEGAPERPARPGRRGHPAGSEERVVGAFRASPADELTAVLTDRVSRPWWPAHGRGPLVDLDAL